mmetsp:Transcript_35622/g.113912  ORF Transcript_35622/g.113912 Transcript_35622/m.113912 type:complete len:215 (-) Transcript_35622:1316-1960(-)
MAFLTSSLSMVSISPALGVVAPALNLTSMAWTTGSSQVDASSSVRSFFLEVLLFSTAMTLAHSLRSSGVLAFQNLAAASAGVSPLPSSALASRSRALRSAFLPVRALPRARRASLSWRTVMVSIGASSVASLRGGGGTFFVVVVGVVVVVVKFVFVKFVVVVSQWRWFVGGSKRSFKPTTSPRLKSRTESTRCLETPLDASAKRKLRTRPERTR